MNTIPVASVGNFKREIRILVRIYVSFADTAVENYLGDRILERLNILFSCTYVLEKRREYKTKYVYVF